jgi:hypothetical protein
MGGGHSMCKGPEVGAQRMRRWPEMTVEEPVGATWWVHRRESHHKC